MHAFLDLIQSFFLDLTPNETIFYHKEYGTKKDRIYKGKDNIIVILTNFRAYLKKKN